MVPSAYGIQARLLAQSLPKYGFTIGVACNFGVGGHVIDSNPKIYPASNTRNGDGNVWAAAEDFKPDVILSLYDVWALEFPRDPRLEQYPWIAWTTVDSAPLDPNTLRKLKDRAAGVVAYSRFGQSVMREAGLAPRYIPLGIETDVFVPINKKPRPAELRGKFIFGMVGRNNTIPSRKGFDVAMLAFAQFAARHDDAYLYLHTCLNKQDGGLSLFRLAQELNITNRVFYCDQAKERFGFPDDYMVKMHQSFDVLLEPSRAEGFGLPIIEAAACGIPTIATNHSSMTELVENTGGWLVDNQPMRMITETWWANPDQGHLLYAMEQAYQAKRTGELESRGRTARRLAERYDFEAYVAPAWAEYLERGTWKLGQSK